MTKQKWILVAVTLLMIGGASGLLVRLKANQKLGEPGVKTEPLPGGKNLRVVLPEWVLHYDSKELQQESVVTNTLPPDTSYGQRIYASKSQPDDQLLLNVVLMGADRTSIHKPQYCLEGAGYHIDNAATAETTIRIPRPQPCRIPTGSR